MGKDVRAFCINLRTACRFVIDNRKITPDSLSPFDFTRVALLLQVCQLWNKNYYDKHENLFPQCASRFLYLAQGYVSSALSSARNCVGCINSERWPPCNASRIPRMNRRRKFWLRRDDGGLTGRIIRRELNLTMRVASLLYILPLSLSISLFAFKLLSDKVFKYLIGERIARRWSMRLRLHTSVGLGSKVREKKNKKKRR